MVLCSVFKPNKLRPPAHGDENAARAPKLLSAQAVSRHPVKELTAAKAPAGAYCDAALALARVQQLNPVCARKSARAMNCLTRGAEVRLCLSRLATRSINTHLVTGLIAFDCPSCILFVYLRIKLPLACADQF